MRYLRGQFPWRIIGKRGVWRSPDLGIRDFFLSGYLKHKIWNVEHDQQPTNLRQLREVIVSVRETLNQQIIQNALDGMVSRAHRCIRSQGGAYFIKNAFF